MKSIIFAALVKNFANVEGMRLAQTLIMCQNAWQLSAVPAVAHFKLEKKNAAEFVLVKWFDFYGGFDTCAN